VMSAMALHIDEGGDRGEDDHALYNNRPPSSCGIYFTCLATVAGLLLS
jgi:hypothetical protein